MSAMRSFFLAVTLLLAALSGPSFAEPSGDALVVPYQPVPQFFVETPAEGLTGFAPELGRRIAEIAGFDIVFRRLDPGASLTESAMRPETDMSVGVGLLPGIGDVHVLSSPVMTSRTMLFVRADTWDDMAPKVAAMAGMRLGVVPGMRTASDIDGAFWDANTRLPQRDVDALILALMDGSVDAAILEEGIMLGRARALALDARIYAVGAPLRQTTRHIALGRHRAGLLGPVNDAIAFMEASGELAVLRRTWNFQVAATEVPPETLTYGVAHVPPYQIIRPDGSITGFSVEVVREVARRAGLDIRFEAVPLPDYGAGPVAGGFDLTVLGLTGDRRARFDHTLPVGRIDFHGYALAERADDLAGRDLADLRLGLIRGSLAEQELGRRDDLSTVIYDDVAAPLAALLAEEVDIVAYPTVLIDKLLADRRDKSAFALVRPGLVGADRAILLRHGLATVRERLNGVIPGFVISEEYRALEARFFGQPVYWTPPRVRLAGMAAFVAALAALAGFALQNWHGRRRWQRQAEQTRLISRRFEAVLETARSGILGIARDGRIVLANPAAQQMLGLDAAALPGPIPADLQFLDPETLTGVEPGCGPFARAAAGQTLASETWALARQSDTRPRYVVVASASIAPEREGVNFAAVVLIDDITEQELNRQHADRSNRLDALGQLTGGIAHDFNNLLTTIKCSAELARIEPDAHGRAELLDTIEAAVRTGSETTARLLAFAQPLPGLARTAAACDVLEDLGKMVRATIESSIALRFECDDPGLEVNCDISQLQNAVLNLILNARDAILTTGVGNSIVVRCAADTAGPGGALHAVFAVTDNSAGMTEEVRRRATDPFFTTKLRKSNSGLGLSMVFGFVQQAGGRMAIDSAPGQGTTVRIALPAALRQSGSGPAAEAPALPRGHGEVILVAEDNDDLLGLLGRKIEYLGYVPRLTRSGDEALALLMAGARVDLLLTDVVMPGSLDGFALARAARSRLPGLPVIYMSGYTGLSPSEAREVDGPLLRKPFSASLLSDALHAALDRADGRTILPGTRAAG